MERLTIEQLREFDSSSEEPKQWIFWAFINVIADCVNSEKIEVAPFYDFEVKINGVEVPFTKTIEAMYIQYERMVTEEAKKLMKDKFGDLCCKLDEFNSMIDSMLDSNSQWRN